ncbi:MAG: sigma 54-interacting transcriptional regulator [Sandaracinus sp.]
MHRTTEKWGEQPKLAVRTLKADVVEGPDAGRSTWTSDERLTLGTAKGNDLVLGDETVSRFHLLVKRTDEGILVVDQRSTNGTFVGGARLGEATVTPGTVIALGRTRVRLANGQDTDVELHDDARLGPLYGTSIPMRRVMAWVRRAASSDASVLLSGESGTGKDVVARALHELGSRASGPFVTVDCGALAPSLVASELFGHERGAFTGADRQHLGALEQAHGGTLFLDEIGELPRELQSVLLGALERRTFRRVGGKQDVSVDVRVIAATNKNLRVEVNGGGFRLDLFYRLAVLALELPPLRERREDVPLLLDHFFAELGHKGGPAAILPEDVREAIARHDWPGNVRELRNFAEATLALGHLARPGAGAHVVLDPPRSTNGSVSSPVASAQPDLASDQLPIGELFDVPFKDARQRALLAFEERYLARLLTKSGGNVSQAAREAGLDRSYLFSLLRRSGLR